MTEPYENCIYCHHYIDNDCALNNTGNPICDDFLHYYQYYHLSEDDRNTINQQHYKYILSKIPKEYFCEFRLFKGNRDERSYGNKLKLNKKGQTINVHPSKELLGSSF